MTSSVAAQQVQPRRRASCPSIQAVAWTPAPSQSTELCSPDHKYPSEDPPRSQVGQTELCPDAASENPDTEQMASSPNATIEVPLKDIPLLGTVPEQFFGPAYDYLGKVKELADEIGPYVWEDCFERHFIQGATRVQVVSGYRCRDFIWNDRPETIFEDIDIIRKDVSKERADDSLVIIVEAIDKRGIQALGMALDVNPSFFANHLGNLDSWASKSRLADNGWVSTCLNELGRKFESHIMTQTRIQRYATTANLHRARTFDCGYLNAELRCTMLATDVQDMGFDGTGRFVVVDGSTYLYPRITCMRGSAKKCIILVDGALPLGPTAYHPFDATEMMQLQGERFPTELPSSGYRYSQSQYRLGYHIEQVFLDKERRDVMLCPDSIDIKAMLHLLGWYIVLDAWSRNVKCLEERLERNRREAIRNPSTRTFMHLSSSRTNILDLERAIIKAKSAHNAGHAVLHEFDQIQYGKMKKPSEEYDALLQRALSMSALLHNEIQAVIGLVAFMDSKIAQEQASRGLLLTTLAAIYLPLSLVTGIFGMNVKEINDATPELWACIIGLIVICGVTMAGLYGLWMFRKSRHARDLQRRRDRDDAEEKIYKLA